MDQARADRDREIHLAGERQVADGAAVQPALGRLELVDQLHRAHLRRARQRAGRERRAQHVVIRHAGLQLAFDRADDVLHVRVLLDHQPVGHLHRADFRDAAHVVAREIDQHHVLGDFLRVVEQFGREFRVAFRRVAARAGAGERADRDDLVVAALLLAHEDFRRRAHHVEIAEIVVIHIRRRVQRAQRAVQRQRVVAIRLRQALADLDLHQLAGRDVFLRLAHGGQIVFLLEFAERLGAHARRSDGRLHGRAQALLQFAQPLLRLRVCLGLARIGVDDQVELAGEVVDHRDFLGQQQLDVGQAEIVARRGVRELLLDVAHRVVAEIAGEAAAEARQAGALRNLEARLERGDEIKRIAVVRLDDLAVAHDFGDTGARAYERACRQADERIAAEAFAADHRFEQERIGAAAFRLRQFQVEGQRRFEVGQGFRDQRDAVVAFVRERLEFEFSHVPVLFGTTAECAGDHGELRGLPSAEWRSIVVCLVPAGASRSANVASLRPALNGTVRARYGGR